MANELHVALTAAGIAPPYLMVGHSLGGIIARRFAVSYPDDVVGMVLVDSSHEDMAHRLGASWHFYQLRRRLQQHVWPLGLRRLASSAGLMPGLEADLEREVPVEHRAAARAITLSSRSRRTNTRELLLMLRLHGEPPDLDSLPLTVLTAAKWPRVFAGEWMQMQAELAATSTRSQHLTADNAGHYVHLDDPEAVIKAIRHLLAATR